MSRYHSYRNALSDFAVEEDASTGSDFPVEIDAFGECQRMCDRFRAMDKNFIPLLNRRLVVPDIVFGANVAVTSGGTTRGHVDRLAWYVDPRDERAMRDAVRAAFEAPRTEDLRRRVVEKFTWPLIATLRTQAYHDVIARHRRMSTE